MAISKNIELGNGIKISNAYLRVECPQLTKNSVMFQLRNYVASDKSFFSECIITSPYDIEGDNPFKQAYLYLKSLPEYADAIDC